MRKPSASPRRKPTVWTRYPHLASARYSFSSHTAEVGGISEGRGFVPRPSSLVRTMSQPPSKDQLRRRLLEERRALDPVQLEADSERIATRIAALPEMERVETVALYRALRGEVRTAPLWEILRRRGIRVVFPRAVPGSRVLCFAPVDDPADLVPGALGVHEPQGDPIDLQSIDLFVVPGLGFDAKGRRLGRGGGYYDATLAAHPPAVRVAPCLRTLQAVPAESHDEGVDVVVTPEQVLRPGVRPRTSAAPRPARK